MAPPTPDHTASTPAPPALSGQVQVAGVSKTYRSGGQHTLALDGLDFTIAAGEFVCLVGASGCGKSTLLNLISGLDSPSTGTITTGGKAALMFQEHALMPWLTAADNVALPLQLAGVPRQQRREQAHALLRTVHLGDAANRRPHQLSGGMRQRVALARTLATQAPVLLMDEPFGALDAMTRDLLHDELESLTSARELTVLFVTHNVREAVRLADRVMLLSSRPGRLVRDYPINIARPRRYDNAQVAALTGHILTDLRQEVARHA